MSAKLDQLLLHWINWYVPDGGDLAELKDARNSLKLQKAYEKLFPIELRPNPEDSLEYIYTAIACYIKRLNHGPDKFTPPQFTTDETRNMMTLLMNLFLLFMIVESESVHFDGETPEWYTNLSQKFQNWDRVHSTTNEFPLTILTENYRAQIDQRNEELQNVSQRLKQLEVDIHTKIERKRETYESLIDSHFEELALAEKKRKDLLDKLNLASNEIEKIEKSHQEFLNTKHDIQQLQKESDQLTAEIEQLRRDEKELAEIKIILSGMGKVEIKNRCESETKSIDELLQKEKSLEELLSKDLDYTERDALLKDVEELQRQLDQTDYNKYKKLWNQNLDQEITTIQRKINKLRIVLAMGDKLLSKD